VTFGCGKKPAYVDKKIPSSAEMKSGLVVSTFVWLVSRKTSTATANFRLAFLLAKLLRFSSFSGTKYYTRPFTILGGYDL